MKFCNFYPHLSLKTIFLGLKLTQNCCKNMNISFLENWQFNQRLALLLLYKPILKNCPRDLTKYESKQNSKISSFHLFRELEDIERSSCSKINKSQFSIFLWIRKKFGVQPKGRIQKSQFWISGWIEFEWWK